MISIPWVALGPWSVGFAFGYATGLSTTPGTTWKVIGAIAGLVGGITAWREHGKETGFLLTSLSFGFVVGITLGAIIRRSGPWDVMDPTWSSIMHNEPTWIVAIWMTLYFGLILGLIFVWLGLPLIDWLLDTVKNFV
jgi:tetrahydromethanopterin S-methyltransferase subunit B